MSPPENFLMPEQQRLQGAFSLAKRRAPSFIAQEVAARMAEKLAIIRLPVHSIALQQLPGDAASLTALCKQYPKAQGLPVEQGFAARLKNMAALRRPTLEVTSTWQLPTQPADLLWANLIAPWWPEPLNLAAQWHAALNDNGFVMFSALGPDTAQELVGTLIGTHDAQTKSTIAQQLLDMHDWGDALVHAGFSDPVVDMEKITLTYRDAKQALQELAALLPTKPLRAGLRSRAYLQTLLQTLGRQRNTQGLIPVTLEVIYGHAFKLKRELKTPTVKLDELKATLPSQRSAK